MATTGILDGTDFLIYVGGTAVSYSESCSINLNMDTMDVTTKDSHNWTDKKPSGRSFDGSADGNVALDATLGIDYFWGLINGRTKVAFKFATDDVSDRFFSGEGYLTNLSVTSPKGAPVTFSISFEGTGKLSFDAT